MGDECDEERMSIEGFRYLFFMLIFVLIFVNLMK